MTRYGITLLAIGLVLVVSQARADDKEDKEKLQGEWRLVSREQNGESETIETRAKFKFEGDNIHSSHPPYDGSFSVDSSKKPKTIDITIKDGRVDGKVWKGLYELDGDTLKICFGSIEMPDRPAEFKSKGDQVFVFTYKRVKK
jgi:uncharacterized protein (TIGR03067 family)